MADRLHGKVAVITGGASGMGRATVEKFVAEGARVVIADLQEDKGRALVAELGAALTTFVATDVCREDDVKTMIGTALKSFGRLDCLFNNAGFAGVTGEIQDTDMGEPYRRTVDAMLTGPILGMKHAAPVMREQRGGVIISTASVAGLKAGYGPHVYTAIKSAVINLTRSVAQELGPFNIRVNAICPGGIATPIFAGQLAVRKGGNTDYAAAVKPFLERMQPIPRAGEPSDIANAACFLASDDASFISGHALVVDGGLTAGSWTNPETRVDFEAAMRMMFGIGEGEDFDMVYHERD
jgi:NAD(P)-dependent dehydrogenase (short-subunit alcohol dehydrogenase family)